MVCAMVSPVYDAVPASNVLFGLFVSRANLFTVCTPLYSPVAVLDPIGKGWRDDRFMVPKD